MLWSNTFIYFNISWYLPNHNSSLQAIDYYRVIVNNGPTILVQNATLTLHGQRQQSYNIRIQAVDQCGSKGEELQDTIMVLETDHPDNSTTPIIFPTESSDRLIINGAKRGV